MKKGINTSKEKVNDLWRKTLLGKFAFLVTWKEQKLPWGGQAHSGCCAFGCWTVSDRSTMMAATRVNVKKDRRIRDRHQFLWICMLWRFKSYSFKLQRVHSLGAAIPPHYFNPMDGGAWWAAVHGVAKSRTRLSDFPFTFHFHALKQEMATHSSVLAWRIPGTGEPGGLPSMGLHRVGHDWSDLAAAAALFPPQAKTSF